MTPDDFKQLEDLLGKLSTYLNERYCVIPGVIQDGYHIATYSKNGLVEYKTISATLKQAADDIIAQKSKTP